GRQRHGGVVGRLHLRETRPAIEAKGRQGSVWIHGPSPRTRPGGRQEATLLRHEGGLGGQVLADLRSAFFAASRFSAFLVCLSARDGLFAVFAAFSFGGLAAFGAFGALGGLATFTALTGLTFGSWALALRSA